MRPCRTCVNIAITAQRHKLICASRPARGYNFRATLRAKPRCAANITDTSMFALAIDSDAKSLYVIRFYLIRSIFKLMREFRGV